MAVDYFGLFYIVRALFYSRQAPLVAFCLTWILVFLFGRYFGSWYSFPLVRMVVLGATLLFVSIGKARWYTGMAFIVKALFVHWFVFFGMIFPRKVGSPISLVNISTAVMSKLDMKFWKSMKKVSRLVLTHHSFTFCWYSKIGHGGYISLTKDI